MRIKGIPRPNRQRTYTRLLTLRIEDCWLDLADQLVEAVEKDHRTEVAAIITEVGSPTQYAQDPRKDIPREMRDSFDLLPERAKTRFSRSFVLRMALELGLVALHEKYKGSCLVETDE